jgi:hypothetical protein
VHAGRGRLPQGRHQPGDLLQLEKEKRRPAATEMRRPKQREDENLKLKQIVADLYWMAPPPLFAVSTQRPQQWGAFLPPTGPGQMGSLTIRYGQPSD